MWKVVILRKRGRDSVVVRPNSRSFWWNHGMADFFNSTIRVDDLPEERGDIALVVDADYEELGV